MAKCVYNEKRKGTRDCPALGGSICSRCCGRYRLSEIDCPDSCVWLQKAMRNHREKYIESGELFETQYYQWLQEKGWGGHPMGRFALAVDTLIHGYLQQQDNPEEHVETVRDAVESLKRKRTGNIVSVEKTTNPLARHLEKEFEAMEEVLPEEEEKRVDMEEEILNGVLEEVEYCAENEIEYSRFLSEFFDKYHLPGYNPVRKGNIYRPGEGEPGSSIIT